MSPSRDTPRPNRRRSRPEPAERKAPQLTRLQRAQVRFIQVRNAVVAPLLRFAQPLLFLGRVVVLVSVALGAVAAGRLVEQHVRRAEAFATSAIELTGNERLSRDQVLKVAGLALGKNVFEVSPEQAEEKLRAHPFIAEATVTRRLPGSYRIELREQEVAALLVLGEQLLLVGQDASVLKKVEPGDPVDLPVITGADERRFAAELSYRAVLLQNAVSLLHDYREAGLWAREPIAEIHVEVDAGLSLFVGQDATSVKLGPAPYSKKLRRLRGIFDALKRDEARPLYVYLDNLRRPDRVTVRLR